MNSECHDPRDIPVLTESIDHAGTLKLADSLLHHATKDIEAALLEQVFERLRAQLPELVDRILTEHALDRPAGAVFTDDLRRPRA